MIYSAYFSHTIRSPSISLSSKAKNQYPLLINQDDYFLTIVYSINNHAQVKGENPIMHVGEVNVLRRLT